MSFSGNKITKKKSAHQKADIAPHLQLFDLLSIDNKRVEVGFTGQDISTDGGLLLVTRFPESFSKEAIIRAKARLEEYNQLSLV